MLVVGSPALQQLMKENAVAPPPAAPSNQPSSVATAAMCCSRRQKPAAPVKDKVAEMLPTDSCPAGRRAGD